MKNKNHFTQLNNCRLHTLQKMIVLFFFSCFTLHLSAQPIGSWQVYPAYTTATYNIPTGHRIYSLMEGKLMAYDTDDGTITTFDWIQQLNDVTISFIHYSAEAKRLIIIYDNGNIDLLSTEDDFDVINLAQLKNSLMQNKTVNNVQVFGHFAYVCTDFGIVIIDMAKGIIQDTYQLNLAVKSCAVNDKAIYAGTSTGLWIGQRSDNLKDKSNWKQFNTNYHAQHMEYFDGCVWAQVDGWLFVSNPEITSFKAVFPKLDAHPKFMTYSDGAIILGTATKLYIISGQDQIQSYEGNYTWNCLTKKGNTYWASDGSNGLQAYQIDQQGTCTLVTSQIHPNSPLHDYSLHLNIVGERLLVAGGNWNYSEAWRPGTAMYLEPDGTWVNFDSQSTADLFPNERYRDVTNILQDPNDDTHHYVGTARSGIFEFKNAKCVGHIGLDNSPLKSILPNNANPQYFVSADAITYDKEGNMWMLNCSSADNPFIRILKKDGTWKSLYCPAIQSAPTVDKILFDSRGWAWLNSRRVADRGICLFKYHDIDNTDDDQSFVRRNIVNQDGSSYSPNNFYDITEDHDGSIWVGTELGTFVIRNPENYESNDFTFEQIKISRDDGSGLADYLFNGIPITCISIDGAGRKWFGTMTNGVYLMSEDCQEQIYHFNTDNSPLPSDEVMDIAIHPSTGKVFFATMKGLCSYMSDATEPTDGLEQENIYAVPNPVNPDYNGPIAIRGLVKDCEIKIVSITGQLVMTGKSNGGTFVWNGCNQNGQRVASGIYIVIANTPDGNTATTTQIAFIR